ncbi:MAG: hybrid sensor histidine kinase/response regulator [Magnetococcales bacterium]|nr:hybrid sensor histidine kinase/response regulator [Magnetococcales bacterium]
MPLHMDHSGPSNLLIVDDAIANIEILSDLLKDDYRILTAKSGRVALDLVTSERIDLILLDLQMPGMDGYEVCRILKGGSETQDIPVIFVTSKDDPTLEARALALGAVDFLAKPVAPSIVKARIRTHLGLKSARETLARQNRELIAAAQLREEVDRIMRHDLKSPLNAIIGFSALLDALLPMNEEQRKMCQLVQESAYKLLNMINLSLEMFKMEQGTYSFEPVRVDLLGLIEKIRAAEEPRIQSRNIDLSVLIDGHPVTRQSRFFILGEELLCYSLLNNLLTNAIEASTKDQTVTISLVTRSSTPCVRIHNQGSVPRAIRDRFFEKYVTFGKAHGTGLGTYSARLMTEVQGGSIAMETSETDGTTIIIHFLPANPVDPADLSPET